MGTALAAGLVLLNATAFAFDGPPREKPLDDPALLEFTDAATQAAALARACPDLLSQEEREVADIALRWARAVSKLPAYDVRLSLTALAMGGDRAAAIAKMDCASPDAAGFAQSFEPFLSAAPDTVRTSEIR